MSNSTRSRSGEARALPGPAAAGAAVGGSDSDDVIILPTRSTAIAQQEWKTSFTTVRAKNEYGFQASEAVRLGVTRATYSYHFQRFLDIGVLPRESVGAPPHLPVEAEMKLVSWVERGVENMTPIMPRQLQAKAKETAISRGVDPSKVGGEKWMGLFLGRHSHLRPRRPQQVEQVRIYATTTTALEKFYKNLAGVFPLYPAPWNKLYLTVNPEKVWNMDETAVMLKQMRSTVSEVSA